MREYGKLRKTLAISAGAALTAGFFVRSFEEYRKNFLVRGAEPAGFLEYYLRRHPELKVKEFSCPSTKEGNLKGLLLLPDEEPEALIVMTHGYNLTIESYLPLGRRFTLAGFAVLLFDGIGCGRSEGRCIYGVPQHAIDMKSVLDYVGQDAFLSTLPLLLFGHSWAGHAATAVSCLGTFPIRGIISCSGFRTPASAVKPSIRRRYKRTAPFWEKAGQIMTSLSYGKLVFLSAEDGLRKAGCPARVYHSKDDPLTSYEESFLEVKEALADCENITFISVDGRGHDVYLLPENSKRQREIQKALKKEPEGAGKQALLSELWQLMCETDEELAREFIAFYKECLK